MKINKRILVSFVICILFSPINVLARTGCCSWHGGIAHCGDEGYYICNDGTRSPSCTCLSYNINNDPTCAYTEKDIKELNDKIYDLESSLGDYKLLFWITLICAIGYYIYKNSK